MDPATAKMAGDMMAAIIGTKQLGAAAPAFQPGAMGFQMGGLLDDQTQPAQQMIQQGPQLPYGSIEDLIGKPQEQGQELMAQAPAQDQMGPPVGTPSPAEGDMAGQMGPPVELAGPENQGGFGGFFGNLDQNLQSPSKVIGMGLLNQIDPRLGAAGLLAGGLFGQNKLF